MQKTVYGCGDSRGRNRDLIQMMLVMQLTMVLLLGCLLQVQATGRAQTVTISGTALPLKTVFTEIEKQTGYFTVYKKMDLVETKALSLDVRNMPLVDLLALALKDQPLTYVIQDKTIVFSKKGEKKLVEHVVLQPFTPIKGRVLSQDGKPAANVSITVKGSNRGTTTDADGNFSLNVEVGQVLVFSSVEFQGKEVQVTNANLGSSGTHLNIVLNTKSGMLDETVIIAYGTSTQRYSAGNVNSVGEDVIRKQSVNNPLLALQGRVPGVFITQSSGISGAGVKILIQGQNSIAKGNDPFYVVDGVPYSSQLLGTNLSGDLYGFSGVNGSVSGNPLNYINPADIESITVLKDADATAIYGSRAANGAILITTKKGKTGKLKLDVNLQQSWANVANKIKVLNTKEYLEVRNEAIRNDGKTVQPTDYDINGFWDTTRNVDWQKELLGNTAHFTSANVSLSGGTAISQYLVSGSFKKQSSVFPGDFHDKVGSLHFNLNSASSDQRFHFQFSGNYLYDLNQLPTVDLTSNAIRLAPNAPKLYNSDGTINWMQNSNGISTYSRNPIIQLANKYFNTTKNLITNIVASYEIIPGLELKSSFGYTNLQANEIKTSPMFGVAPEERGSSLRSSLFGNSTLNSWIVEPQLSYKRVLGKSVIDAVIGESIQQSNN